MRIIAAISVAGVSGLGLTRLGGYGYVVDDDDPDGDCVFVVDDVDDVGIRFEIPLSI